MQIKYSNLRKVELIQVFCYDVKEKYQQEAKWQNYFENQIYHTTKGNWLLVMKISISI